MVIKKIIFVSFSCLMIGFRSGDFSFTYENDGTPFYSKKLGGGLGDGQDRWRSAAFSLGIGDFSAGVNIFTGKREYGDEAFEGVNPAKKLLGRLFNPIPQGESGGFGANLPYGAVNERGQKHRLGAAFLSWKNYNVGVDSYRHIGHPVQNIGAHYFASPQRGFITTSESISPYFLYKTRNIFSSW